MDYVSRSSATIRSFLLRPLRGIWRVDRAEALLETGHETGFRPGGEDLPTVWLQALSETANP